MGWWVGGWGVGVALTVHTQSGDLISELIIPGEF